MLSEAYIAAFIIGGLGAGHCIGMCGGIAAALSFATPKNNQLEKLKITFSYNLGRLFSYGLIGLVFGLLGQSALSVWSQNTALPVLRVLAGALLIFMGLYLLQVATPLKYLEKAGGFFWRRIQPLGNKLMPVKTAPQALLLGAIWGWLPCGLVYSALAYAMLQPSAVESALTMVAFGAGTLPALILGGLAGAHVKDFIQKRWFRGVSGILVMLFGAWTIWIVILHSGHSGHGHHSEGAVGHEHHESGSQHQHHSGHH